MLLYILQHYSGAGCLDSSLRLQMRGKWFPRPSTWCERASGRASPSFHRSLVLFDICFPFAVHICISGRLVLFLPGPLFPSSLLPPCSSLSTSLSTTASESGAACADRTSSAIFAQERLCRRCVRFQHGAYAAVSRGRIIKGNGVRALR